jgi:hypothetical protein
MVRKVWTRWRRLLKTAGVLCALVAGTLAFPNSACASCGDYVIVHPPGDGTHGDSRPTSHPSHQDQQPKPCSGPSCSGHPLPNPPPPPESSVNTLGERWADLASAVPPCERPHAALAPIGRMTGLARHPSDVYHPPR